MVIIPWRERAIEIWKENTQRPNWGIITDRLMHEFQTHLHPETVRSAIRNTCEYKSLRGTEKPVLGPPAHSQTHCGKTERKSRPETAVWHLTDIHEGKKTDSFDPDVLEERLLRGAKRIVLITQILKKTYTLDKLVIAITGDVIDNDSIYPNQQSHVSEKAKAGRQQVNRLTETMAMVIDILKQEYAIIEVECVYGNHGRISKTTDEKNNWDLVFYDQLKAYYTTDSSVTVNISEKFYKVVDIQGHGFLLYHGHAIKMSHGIPWYGMTKRIGAWKTSIGGFRYALVGHFHTIGMTQAAGVDIYMGGCCPTGDDWALEGLGTKSDQRYWFFGVHEEQGITWEYKIDLL